MANVMLVAVLSGEGHEDGSADFIANPLPDRGGH